MLAKRLPASRGAAVPMGPTQPWSAAQSAALRSPGFQIRNQPPAAFQAGSWQCKTKGVCNGLKKTLCTSLARLSQEPSRVLAGRAEIHPPVPPKHPAPTSHSAATVLTTCPASDPAPDLPAQCSLGQGPQCKACSVRGFACCLSSRGAFCASHVVVARRD